MSKIQFSIKNFFWGMVAGFFFSLLAYLNSAYCGLDFSRTQGIIGIGVAMLAFGITAAIFGIDRLMDNLPG